MHEKTASRQYSTERKNIIPGEHWKSYWIDRINPREQGSVAKTKIIKKKEKEPSMGEKGRRLENRQKLRGRKWQRKTTTLSQEWDEDRNFSKKSET